MASNLTPPGNRNTPRPSAEPPYGGDQEKRYVASTLVGRKLLELWETSDRKNREVSSMSPLKIVNIAYICHGMHMAFNNGSPLVSESVRAWDHGPIFPDLFYGSMEHANETRLIRRVLPSKREEIAENVILDEDEIRIIEVCYESHKLLDDNQLVFLNTRIGTPWYQIWNDKNRSGYVDIENDLIYEFYREIMEAAM